ncbi:MAG: hypothetical protein ACRELX_06025 [Longimicrobiales bacterium]
MADPAAPPPRRTPYELVFRDGGLEYEALPAIAQEAESRNVDPADPERFLMLAESGKALRRMRPDSADSTPGTAVAQYGALLFHGFHFWRAGEPLFVVAEDALRTLLASPPEVGAWTLDPPASAGYLQLPRHRVWLPAAGEGAPEPIDGFFWTTTSPANVAGGDPTFMLHLALVIGVRPGRPGFGVVELSSPLPPPPVAHWADVAARDAGRDFENILPGGEIEGLFALTSVAEALRLASLLFHFARDDRVSASIDAPEAAAPAPHSFPPTALAYRRITLAGTDG